MTTLVDAMAPEVAATVKSAALVTVGVLFLYFVSIILQARTKFALKAEAQKKKERFLRYANTDARMVIADRLVGNFLEWTWMFLALFWTHVALTNSGIMAGWVYCACRGLYIVLAMGGGLGTSGPKNMILASTVPAYGVLMYMMFNIARAALL